MRIIFFLSIVTFLFACTNNRNDVDAFARKPYYECQVWSEEGSPFVTVNLEYLPYGSNGQGAKLKRADSVLLDGETMPADSSAHNGIIYQTEQASEGFTGLHALSFVDDDGISYKEDFRFLPFSLAEELPDRLKKAPFNLKLKNFTSEWTTVRLVLTDTSFSSRGVNETVPVENGEIHVTESQLTNLVAGPVTLKIYGEVERPLKQKGKLGGRIQIMYSLQREVELVK